MTTYYPAASVVFAVVEATKRAPLPIPPSILLRATEVVE
jgi:hypothetical protein